MVYAASSGAETSHFTGIRVAPDIKVDFQFYRVSGADVATVMHQIAKTGADRAGGHIGKASYQLTWQLQTRPTAARCELEQARVTARIQVRVPNWMDKAKASAVERQKWDKLVAAMFDYESRHKDILLESVSQLGIRLAQLPVTQDCAALQYQGWQQGQAALASTRERFATLAQQTDQGRKLGLNWPKGS
ncbi:hypothetical protein CUC44_06850 [Aeromonas lusitana]|uniref:DUF922 domain-containing protein n=1 Tax=Aeromonas lusitana TaxID=931529 RepID=A0A2M8HBY6_9GAMM|nr:hypothetical protein CUC44_06850 [Aeromonas lusitana]